MDKEYHRADRAERLALAWRWVEAEARFNALEAEIEPLREALLAHEKAIAALIARATAVLSDLLKATHR